MKQRIVSLVLVLCMLLPWVHTTAFATEEQPAAPILEGDEVDLYTEKEWELLKLTNQERLANGLEPLCVFEGLQRAAGVREQELISRFSPVRPGDKNNLTVLTEAGINYSAAGENIAVGQSTARSALRVWLNDDVYRANLLNPDFTHIGMGYTDKTCTIMTETGTGRIRNGWVQLFMDDACTITDISVSEPSVSCDVGSTLDALKLHVEAVCSVHGICYLPLVTEMCTGFDGEKAGKQTVSVAYAGQTAQLQVTVGSVVEPEPELPVGTITDTGRSLSLSGEVFINQYVKAEGFEGVDIAAKGGLLVWNREVSEDEAVYGTADTTQQGLIAYKEEYTQRTLGIPARCYADELYLRVYIEVADGEYIYGPLACYSVQEYCQDKIAGQNYEDKLKETCAALLHFGTAAQSYFGYNVEDPANANILNQYSPVQWDAGLLTQLDPIPATELVSTGDVTDNGQSVSLTGAIKVNFYFGFSGDVSKAELLVWDGASGAPSEENVSYTQELIRYQDEYTAQSRDFVAREYGKTIFACARITDNMGAVHYSDVIAFSPEAYAAGKLDHSDETLVELVKRMVVYGETARVYFER